MSNNENAICKIHDIATFHAIPRGKSKTFEIEGQGNLYYYTGESRPSFREYMIGTPWTDFPHLLMSAFLIGGLYQYGRIFPLNEDDLKEKVYGHISGPLVLMRYNIKRKTGHEISVESWRRFVDDLDDMTIDFAQLFPNVKLPINDETMPRLWAYRLFGGENLVGKTIPEPTSQKFTLYTKTDLDEQNQLTVAEKLDRDRIENEKWRGKTQNYIFGEENESEKLESKTAVYDKRTVYEPVLNAAKEGSIVIEWSGKTYQPAVSFSMPSMTKCRILFPPSATPRLAKLFLEAYLLFDSQRTIDFLTSLIDDVDYFLDNIDSKRDAQEFYSWLKKIKKMKERAK